MNTLFVNAYLFVMAIALALLEIQVEGEHGWAKRLPTWRPHRRHWLARTFRRVMSGKDLTGYHLAIFGFVLLMFHLPYVFGLPFVFEHWLKTISLYFLFITVWDFLWFVMNPHHPLSRFVGDSNPVHHRWLGPLPLDYYGSVALSLLVILPLVARVGLEPLIWWLTHLTSFVVLTLLVVWFTLKVLDIDNWLKR